MGRWREMAAGGEKSRDRKAPKRVVEYVNRLRKEMGEGSLEDLPPGRCGIANACPIANALPGEVEVDQSGIFFYALPEGIVVENETVDLPGYVAEFVRRFDAGMYPDLIEAAA